jgi:hypothetical protein
VWVAALESGYAPHARFVKWADQLIDRDPYQPRWVLDLSLTKDLRDAVGVLRLEWSRQCESPANGVPPIDVPGNLHLGFLYLRYKEGSLSMSQLLELAGMYSDSQGYGKTDASCESFFYLLNELEGRQKSIPSDAPLTHRVDEFFAPFASAARVALSDLPSAS